MTHPAVAKFVRLGVNKADAEELVAQGLYTPKQALSAGKAPAALQPRKAAKAVVIEETIDEPIIEFVEEDFIETVPERSTPKRSSKKK